MRNGDDLELFPYTFLIDSEQKHHRKNLGYCVALGMSMKNKVYWIEPSLTIKMHIKKEFPDLMKGKGDFAACIRIAIYISRKENKDQIFEELLKLQN